MPRPRSLTPNEREAKEQELASLLRKLEELRRHDLLGEYCPGGTLEPTDKQREFHRLGAHYRFRMLSAANQAQPISEPVWTPKGERPIGELAVGDWVLDAKGLPTRVLEVYPQGKCPIFRVLLSDGTWTRATADHLWYVKLPTTGWRTRTTEQLRHHYQRYRNRPTLPQRPTLNIERQEVPLDPYTLGYLIADGRFATNGGIGVASIDGFPDLHVPEGQWVQHDASHWYLRQPGATKRALQQLGLWGCQGGDKFLPPLYLINDAETRLAFLQGLMDGDGGAHPQGQIYYWAPYGSKHLVEGVAFLVRSLGGKARVYDRGDGWNTDLSMELPPFRAKRLARWKPKKGRSITIESIDPDGEEEAVCIHVKGNLYITRHMIPTHNSGKTLSAGMELAMHLTGRYPDWWEGKVFDTPQLWWVAGVTGESTRDNPQRILLGQKREYGTGTIPKEAFHGQPLLKRGVPDAVDSFQVRWGGGGDTQQLSTVWFKSYDQEREKWQGATLHGVWMDEEPPFDIFDEARTRLTYHSGIMPITFTPLQGMTEVCQLFFEPSEDDPGRAERVLIHMDLRDAHFYSEDKIELIEAGYPAHMRRARARGLPTIGEGLVYPVPDEDIICPPFEIPSFMRRIIGLDFGIDHPTAAVWLAWNPDNDTVYITDTYKQTDARMVLHARALVEKGADRIPVSWPHDGLKRLPQRDYGDASPMKDIYSRHGCLMLPYSARYDPDKGGAQPREPIISQLLERLQTGRVKVFESCQDWLREKNSYYRKDGQPVARNDDLLSATHYALMMLRYSRSPVEAPRQAQVVSDYDPLTQSLGG